MCGRRRGSKSDWRRWSWRRSRDRGLFTFFYTTGSLEMIDSLLEFNLELFEECLGFLEVVVFMFR